MGKEALAKKGLSAIVFLSALGIDQLSKSLVKPAHIYYNPGLIFGIGQNLPPSLRLVALCSSFGFIFFVYLCLLYFLPRKQAFTRIALSLLMGGVAGNVADKAFYSHTSDFIQLLNFPVYFNIADAFQAIGAGALAYSVLFKGDELWFKDSNRGQYLIRPKEQVAFALRFSVAAMCCSLITGLFSYTFLRQALVHLPASRVQDFLVAFGLTHIALTCIFSLAVFVAGIVLSHRAFGPLYAFEKFVDDLLTGKDRPMVLRDGDEFKHLVDIGERLRQHIKKDPS